ncbi:MAG TPA: hypothetical protein VFK69_07480 [Candidatus Eisenbacteria bacterium]|nr:hypothetical protein [Candidatus Eisenbacteria bacterium]
MILWIDGAHSPADQMARDAALLAAAERGAAPVLRLFRFRPPGITLGYAQDPARVLDLARCAAAGVPWAVRPTGGRAIFHAEEWTYAFAAPRADPLGAGTLAECYARVSGWIAGSLARLGVPARLAGGRTVAERPEDGGHAARALRQGPCFASTARHEIVLAGRKLVGSAQRRTARAVLQQGSVLLGDGHLALADCLALAPDARARTRRMLEAAATHAGPWLGADPPLERWAAALLPGLPAGTVVVRDEAGETLLAPEPAPARFA